MTRSSKINKKTVDEKADKKISVALISSFVILTVQYFVLNFFNLLGTTTAPTVQLLSKVLVGLAFLYALPTVLKRRKVEFIGGYFTAVFIFILHYLIFPDNHLYLKELLFPFFVMSFPAFVYSLSIRNWGTFKEIMKKSSYIVFVFGTVLGGLIFAGRASAGTYSMSLSYYMLLPSIMFLDELFDKFSVRILLFVGISLLVILALGSRGAILCIVVFVFLKSIRPNVKLTYKRALTYFGLFGAGIIGYLHLSRILDSLYTLLLSFGINSRSISLFLRDEVHLSGRDRIYESLILEVANNPFLGVGIGGDRLTRGGGYAHNLFLEILVNFGVILGPIVIVLLCVLIIKSLLNKDREKYTFFIIWLSLGFVHLMVSSTYITDIRFWIFLGVSINLCREQQSVKLNLNNNVS